MLLGKTPVCSITNVTSINQGKNHTEVDGRYFHAISFRVKSDASITFNNHTINLGSGDIMYMPPYISFKRTCSYDNMIIIHFEVSGSPALSPSVISVPDYELFKNKFLEIYDVWNSQTSGFYAKGMALFYDILYNLDLNNNFNEHQNTIIRDAIAYINLHYSDSGISVTNVAYAVNSSVSNLRKLFSYELNISPKEYIIKRRIQEAKLLIDSRYMSLSEISDSLGFCDQRYFSTVFKRLTGMTPSQYSLREYK